MGYWLQCRACGTQRAPGPVDYRCAACGGEEVVRYASFGDVDESRPGMWRYASRLPVRSSASCITLGEGGTPLLPLTAVARGAGIGALRLKAEHHNPTGSFKDRIAALAVTIAKERSLRGLAGTSSGNGGAAAAAYGTRAGIPLHLFALADIPAAKLAQIRALGATAHLVQGIGHDARATDVAARTIAAHAARTAVFPFLTGGRFSPEAMEAVKTIAYEIADSCTPDVVYAPVGGGGLLAGLGRGFAELAAAGRRVPRLVGVQPRGCSTLTAAMAGDLGGLRSPSSTSISGLQVAILFDGAGAVEAVRGSGGHVTEIDDEDAWEAQRLLAREEGVLVEPAGAVALAGLLADLRAGRARRDSEVVVVATGAGYKDEPALRRISGDDPLPVIDVESVGEVLARG